LQDYPHFSADSRRAVDFDFTTVITYDAVGQRHAEAGAIPRLFGGDKGFEYPGTEFVGHTVAMVAQADLDQFRGFARQNSHATAGRAGVIRIGEDVYENLAQALPVTFNIQLGVAVDQDIDILVWLGQSHQLGRLLQATPEVEPVFLQFVSITAAAEVNQGLNDVVDALGLLQNALHFFAHLAVTDFFFEILCKAGNSGDRVTDLMGNTRGKTADRRQPLVVRQLILQQVNISKIL